jgi:hypothetical protein
MRSSSSLCIRGEVRAAVVMLRGGWLDGRRSNLRPAAALGDGMVHMNDDVVVVVVVAMKIRMTNEGAASSLWYETDDFVRFQILHLSYVWYVLYV